MGSKGEEGNSYNNDEEEGKAMMKLERSSDDGDQKSDPDPLKLQPHKYPKKRILNLVGLFVAVAVACVVLYSSSSSSSFRTFPITPFLFSLKSQHQQQGTVTIVYTKKELENVLGKAAMADNTVIITTINEAWAIQNSTFELFLESFRIGNETQWLLNHLVVVALDHNANLMCQKLHSNCYHLKTVGSNFSGEARFMAPDYLRMMWMRIDFLHTVLKLGYNFIFTDVDIMWFRNPFPHFFPEADFQIACDHYYGNPRDINNSPNGGFTFVRSNNRTKQFYKFWYKSKDAYPGKHDQDVLNMIKRDPFIKKIGLSIRFLNTAYFGGFCETSKDLNLVCTMHANCCKGLGNKVHDLKILLEDWNKYLAVHKNKTAQAQLVSWSVPQNCGPKSFRN